MCGNSSDLWFQEGRETQELHEIQLRCIEIIADEFFVHNVLNLGFQDSEPAYKFGLSRH
jgi:hypothetical protein